MITHSLSGLSYLLEGFKLLAKPQLKRFIVFPLLLNIVLFLGIFWISQHYFSAFTHWVDSYLPHWLRWMEGILWLLFFIFFTLVVAYSFVTAANIVGAPFNSLLSTAVELELTGKKPEQENLARLLQDLPRVLGRQLAILGYYLPRALLLLALFFIPVLQIIAGPLFFIFNAWFMALQILDYPTDNHRIPLTQVKQQLIKKRFLTLSFGLSVLVLSLIPFVNFFVIPAAVAGGTKLWLKEFQSKI